MSALQLRARLNGLRPRLRRIGLLVCVVDGVFTYGVGGKQASLEQLRQELVIGREATAFLGDDLNALGGC